MIIKYEVVRAARVCELLIGVAGPTPLPVFGLEIISRFPRPTRRASCRAAREEEK